MADNQYENRTAGELRDILKTITGELSRQRTIQAESAAEYRKMDSIARQLQDTTMGVSNLTSEELIKLKEKNQNHIKELQYQAERLTRQKIGASFEGHINKSIIDRLKFLGKISTQEEAILRAASDGYVIEKQLTAESEEQYKKRLAFEKQVSNSLGVSGSIIGGINSVMDKLGINSGIFKDHVNMAQKAMQEAAENAARNKQHLSKTSVMMKGLAILGEGFGKALLDPLTIITAILDGLFRVNKATVDVQRLTGQYETSIAGVNDRLATSAQFLQTAAELTRQWGVSATLVFSPDQIAQLAETKNLLGLSAEQAGRMGMLMKITGKSADQVGQGIYDTVNAYNGANRTAIAHGIVLQDILGASDSITASLGNSEKKIGAAATAARRLGLSLSEVDAIAGSLMNFEDSISNELEAQLLTGKNITLAKAREYAMTNDLEGLSKELAKNGATAAEFANMGRIEQESLAKALGISRDQLAKSVLTQEAMNSMTDKQIAKARGVTLEQSKAMDVQAKLQTAIQKLTEAFAPLLDAVVPIVDALLAVIKPFAQLIAIVAGNPFGKLTIGALALASALEVVSLKTIANTVATVTWNVVKGASLALWNSNIMLAIRERVALVANTAAKYASIVAERAWNGVKAAGVALGNTAIGQYIIEKANLIATTVAKWANVGATTAQTAANAGLAATQTTLGTTGAAAGGGMAAAGAGLGAFGAAAAPAIPVILAIGAALLLASPAIWAFSKVIEAVGTVIIGVMKELPAIITAVADGFVKIMGAVTMDNIGPMLLLGPALFGIAAGLGAIAVAGVMAIPTIGGLVMLAAVSPALVSLADAFGMGGESATEAKGKSEEGSIAAVEAKLTELIAVVKAGGNVYLDANKVGRAQVLGSYKSS